MSQLIHLLEAPLRWLPVGNWSNPSQLLLIVALFTIIGTYVLVRILSGAKTVTGPICFWVLFACSMGANRLLSPYRLPGSNEIQNTIAYTTVGMVLGSLILLATLKSASRGES
jgi:uncharacterized membrane protein YhhN